MAWHQAGCQLDSMAVNVSSVQFNQPDLVDIFHSIVTELGLAASCIEIEITERLLMANSEQNRHVLEEMREIVFRISVDDFGTGYSSMSYLKSLPLDIIKIDKSFIDDIPDDQNDVEITKAILALSHSLGYTVVAEGVEKPEQLHLLQRLNCEIAQGYLFSKPVPADQLQQLLSHSEDNRLEGFLAL